MESIAWSGVMPRAAVLSSLIARQRRYPCIAALLLPLACLGAESPAEDPPPVTILIENVRLIQGDATTDPVVNILIRKQKLEILTKDEVPIEEATIRVDAQRGFLLGKLELGAESSFLILDGDPREQFEVLLDTREHVVFAVEKGQIVRNRLLVTAEAPSQDKPEQKIEGGEMDIWSLDARG